MAAQEHSYREMSSASSNANLRSVGPNHEAVEAPRARARDEARLPNVPKRVWHRCWGLARGAW